MKFKLKPIFIVFLFIGFGMSFQSCLKDDCEGSRTFVRYTPVYKTVDEIRQDIKILPARTLRNPGKIYYYDNHIVVNEIREGLHIIDNNNPESPINVAFIQIPGNVDMAVKENILYADNYIDLLAIDISNPSNPILKDRTQDVFSSLSLHQELGHLVYYEETEETVEIECSDPRWGGGGWFRGGRELFVSTTAVNSSSGGFNNAPVGVAGSMARFAIYDNFLYTIDERNVDVFNITTTSDPVFTNTFSVGWGIETLFPYGDKLFIGSQTGMFIYDNADPQEPAYLSQFQHARACDPVFVKDNYAFVTLRGGTPCEGFNNQLDIIDVTDLSNPFLVESYGMDNPHGLSIRGDALYLCDGSSGLKVFDISNVNDIKSKDEIDNIDTYDAISIPNKEIVLVVGKGGLYQYNTNDITDLKEISSITIHRD